MGLRLIEIGLFLLPITLFVLAWWSGRVAPSPAMLAASLLGLALFGTALVWFGVEGGLSPGERYVPARLVHGQIEPGHAAGP
jgi:hypothetical protein